MQNVKHERPVVSTLKSFRWRTLDYNLKLSCMVMIELTSCPKKHKKFTCQRFGDILAQYNYKEVEDTFFFFFLGKRWRTLSSISSFLFHYMTKRAKVITIEIYWCRTFSSPAPMSVNSNCPTWSNLKVWVWTDLDRTFLNLREFEPD